MKNPLASFFGKIKKAAPPDAEAEDLVDPDEAEEVAATDDGDDTDVLGGDEDETGQGFASILSIDEPGGKLKLALIAGLLLVVSVGAGGGVWMWLDSSGQSEDSAASEAPSPISGHSGTQIMVTLPVPKPGQSTSAAGTLTATGVGLTPPGDHATSETGGTASTNGGPAIDAKTRARLAVIAPHLENERGVAVLTTPKNSFEDLALAADSLPLSVAPLPEMIDPTALGPLPRPAIDGRVPWKAYARPFNKPSDQPRVSIVVAGLGLSASATQAAIRYLPSDVTLAFSPYSRELGRWIPKARAAGHEVLLGLPMEPLNYPLFDPGTLALMTNLSAKENMARMHEIMGSAAGYVGMISIMGSQFTASDRHFRPIATELKQRGLMFLDARGVSDNKSRTIAKEIGLPRAVTDVQLDQNPDPRAIDLALATLEQKARKTSAAVAIAAPYPSTIRKIAAWAKTLDGKKMSLAPLTAIAGKQLNR